MTNLRRRVLALEGRKALNFPQRIVVRYPGEEPYQPQGDIDENTLLVIVKYVEAPLRDAKGTPRPEELAYAKSDIQNRTA